MPVMLRGQETDNLKMFTFGKATGNRHICKPGTLARIVSATLKQIDKLDY